MKATIDDDEDSTDGVDERIGDGDVNLVDGEASMTTT